MQPAKVDGKPGSCASDVRQFYRLANEREPESDAVAGAFAALDVRAMVPLFFSSDEFRARIIDPLLRGEDPWGQRVPPADLLAWAASILPLTAAGTQAVAGASSWPGLILTLFSDPDFLEALGRENALSAPAEAALAGLAEVFGSVERLDGDRVSGWAMARVAGSAPVRIEVWIDGGFAVAGVADRFNRFVQDQFGGDGIVGFEIRIPPAAIAGRGSVLIEVRAGLNRRTIGRASVDRHPPVLHGIEGLRCEIAAIRSTLERLERQLPANLSRFGRPLIDYPAYFEDWYRTASLPRDGGLSVAVLLDGGAASPVELDAAAQAVMQQMSAGDHLALVVRPDLAGFGADVVNRARGRFGVAASCVVSDSEDAAVRIAALDVPDLDIVVLAPCKGMMAPFALSAFAAAFARPGVLAVYGDEDALEPADLGEAADRRHINPVFRPGPDRDLLLQLAYAGDLLAFRRRVIDTAALARDCDGLHGCDRLLSLSAEPGAIAHLPFVLFSRFDATAGGAKPEAWAGCVTRELKRTGEAAEVLPHVDILGAHVAGAVRVKTLAAPARTSIIVPTRDALSLLQPCLDSLLARRAENQTEMELIVIDHQSREPETLAYLDGLVRQGAISVIPYEGAFNWALMNNLAADRATGEVLVFLNNDTVVLTPDWLDELASQALRPEVGVVGCRLLYADGTIQHAGFISRGNAPDFLIHDGVGVPGSDGGYLGRHALLHASPVVTGACMAVRTGAFRALGGFDAANFPLEGNDADFCYRARAEGLSVIYDPYATLYHLESKTRGFSVSGEDRATSLAAQALLRQRWGERFGEDPGFNPHFDRTGRPFDRLRPPLQDPALPWDQAARVARTVS